MALEHILENCDALRMKLFSRGIPLPSALAPRRARTARLPANAVRPDNFDEGDECIKEQCQLMHHRRGKGIHAQDLREEYVASSKNKRGGLFRKGDKRWIIFCPRYRSLGL